MGVGKALVSRAVGAEGVPVGDDQELLLVEDGVEFGTAVLHLLNHPEERQRLGQAAQQFARQYDWRVVVPKFLEIYEELLK